jgi:cytochrome c oxidase cbb3-type subunit 1
MTTALHNNAPAEVDATDASARCPLSLLIASGLLWLVLGGGLALLNLVQLYTPAFLADCAWFTYGRLQAMQETALVYGWAANAGLAVALWLLARLGGNALRGLNYITVGALFWNLGITLSLVGIALGDATSFSLLQMPRYVQPIMLFAYTAIAVPGVLGMDRTPCRTDVRGTMVCGGRALSFSLVFLRGASDADITCPCAARCRPWRPSWYGQNVFSLWLAPLGDRSGLLPGAQDQRPGDSELRFRDLWFLVIADHIRRLDRWPAPDRQPGAGVDSRAWQSSVVGLVLFHHLIVFFNLREVFSTGGSTVLKFLAVGLFAYLLGGLADAVFSAAGLAQFTQFTYFQQAQSQLALGAFSMILLGRSITWAAAHRRQLGHRWL